MEKWFYFENHISKKKFFLLYVKMLLNIYIKYKDINL